MPDPGVTHRCLESDPACEPARLCDACLGRDLVAKRAMGRTCGAVWAEQVALKHPEVRDRASWPEDAKALAIARRKVAQLAEDPRVVEDLAGVCLGAAVAWWERRGPRYR